MAILYSLLSRRSFLYILTMVLFFSISPLHTRADIPYLPLKIKMYTDHSKVLEGDEVVFTVTVINTDAKNSHPVFLPAAQNTGTKLFYFRVFDQAANVFRQIAIEDRHMGNYLVHDNQRWPELMWLKSNDSIQFTAVWNSTMNFFNTECHHSFDTPITPGRYYFQGLYDPSGIPGADTLYHFYSATFEEMSSHKLNIPSGGLLTNPIAIQILKGQSDLVLIDRVPYRIVSESKTSFTYLKDDTILAKRIQLDGDGNLIFEMSTDFLRGDPGSMDEYIIYFPDGNFKEYYRYNKNECPGQYFYRKFNDDGGLEFKSDQLPDGSHLSQWYSPAGILTREWYYSADRSYLLEKMYSTKTGRLKTVNLSKYPCLEVLLHTDH